MRIRVEESERLRERGDRLDSEKEDLQQRLESLKLECIRLTDMVTDLQGNIRVFCRVRPVSSVEAAALHTTHTAIAAMVSNYSMHTTHTAIAAMVILTGS